MPSMLETLLAQGVERTDKKRLTATLRPLPVKPRDIFDLIVGQGREPSFAGLIRSVELKGADPRSLTYVMLGRWPTPDELADLPAPYNPKHHMRDLLQSPEFRRSFLRRLLDAFPDRRRLLCVTIPRSGAAHVMQTAAVRHPIMPQHIADDPRMSPQDVLNALGQSLYRFNSASTVVVTSPRLEAFLYPRQPPPVDTDLLRWNLVPPPYRAGDLLFATIREPRSLLLSHVNAALHALRMAAPADAPARTDISGWKDIGRRILRETTLRNPICTALGDGTASSALGNCRTSGIDLIGLSRQTDWVRTAFSTEPAPLSNHVEKRLLAEDLTPADLAHLDGLIDQDREFYVRFAAHFDAAEVSAVSGSAL